MENKCGTWLQDADMYARPVGLTYNGRKTHKTVNGGLCSIVSFLILLWYMVNHFLQLFIDKYEVYTTNQKIEFLNTLNPPKYSIPTEQFQLFTNITTQDPTIRSNLSAYVGGVYVQEDSYPNAIDDKYQETFFEMVKCPEVTTNVFNISNFDDYYCPDMKDFQLQGGLETNAKSHKTKTLGFKVFTCPTMNRIRKQKGWKKVPCADDYLKNIDTI